MPDVTPLNLPKFSEPKKSKQERREAIYWRAKVNKPDDSAATPTPQEIEDNDANILQELKERGLAK
jgi:hypothetical protein